MNLFLSSGVSGGTAGRATFPVGVDGVGVAGFGNARPSIVGSGPTAATGDVEQRHEVV